MSGTSVLVFGATGAVGGAAAQEAAERGNKVWLATRDPTKPISWLTKEKEDDGTFVRIKADLGDPKSIIAAVQQSGAKSAFVYIVHGVDPRPTYQALKDAGVTWVVLLSSFTIQGDLTKYTPETYIPYHHAQGELALQDVGIAYGAVRPGYFASNVLMFFVPDLKQKGEVKLVTPDQVKYDYIVPENIGRVAGALLNQPKPHLKPTEPEVVYVYGPNFESLTETAVKVGKAMGKDIKVNSVSDEEFLKDQGEKGVPSHFAQYLIDQGKAVIDGTFYEANYKRDQAENIQKYTGKQPITFDQYLESIKSEL